VIRFSRFRWQPSGNTAHSTTRYVRLCGESVGLWYCYSLCFCWHYS